MISNRWSAGVAKSETEGLLQCAGGLPGIAGGSVPAPKMRSNATAPFSAHVTVTPSRFRRRVINCLVIESSSTTSACKGVSRCIDGAGDGVVVSRPRYGGDGGFTGVGRDSGRRDSGNNVVLRSGKVMKVGRFSFNRADDARGLESTAVYVVSDELDISAPELVNGGRPVSVMWFKGASSTSPPRFKICIRLQASIRSIHAG